MFLFVLRAVDKKMISSTASEIREALKLAPKEPLRAFNPTKESMQAMAEAAASEIKKSKDKAFIVHSLSDEGSEDRLPGHFVELLKEMLPDMKFTESRRSVELFGKDGEEEEEVARSKRRKRKFANCVHDLLIHKEQA